MKSAIGCLLLIACVDVPELDEIESELASGARLCKSPGIAGPCRAFGGDDLSLVADTWSDGTAMSVGAGSLEVAAGYRATVCEGERFSPRCTTATGPAAVDLALTQVWSIEVKPVAAAWYTHFDATNQSEAGLGHVYPSSSEMGAGESNEMQGVAHDPVRRTWFFTSRGSLYRIPVSADVAAQSSVLAISRQYGTHWGDPDYAPATDTIYIPNYDSAGNAWVEAYDHDLRWKDWARFPGTGTVGWVAINPLNGMLYAARTVPLLDVYDPNAGGGATMTKLYTINLAPALVAASGKSIEWWNQVWNQGGAFDTNGEFYLVADHPSESQSSATGVYAFALRGREASVVRFANIKYDPETCWGCSRNWELEGLTIWDLDTVSTRHPSIRHKIHVLSVHTEPDDDDVSFHHIPDRIPARSVVRVFEHGNYGGRSDYFYLEEIPTGVLYNLHAYNGYSLAIADRGSSMTWSSVAGNRCWLEFYEHADGSGRRLATGTGQGALPDLAAYSFGDRMSAFRKLCN
jgi:hypothetical protein